MIRFDKSRQTGLEKIAAVPKNDAGGFCRRRLIMNAIKIVGVVLIVAGILGLVYGSFSYTKETHEAKIGPLEFQVKEKETVNVPVWAGVGAIVVGTVLLLVPLKR
jgi:uncharacterized membrane protein YidH (DUF202 family)